MKQETRRFKVHSEEAGMRLDKFLAMFNEDTSRTFIQDLIKKGLVQVSGNMVKASYKMKADDVIEMIMPPPTKIQLIPQNIPIDILYEDESLIAVDKPPGLVVHPAPGHPHGTLVNALLYHCEDLAGIGGKLRPGIVHRLDRDTSGVMVVAKNSQAHRKMVAAFKERQVEKIYLALVQGVPPEKEGRIQVKVGRHPKKRKVMAAGVEAGREAITDYKVIETVADTALLSVFPQTGRTHQIRVHLAWLGYPVKGDRIYGTKAGWSEVPRQMLHSYVLALQHPSQGSRISFKAPVPEDFQRLLKTSGFKKDVVDEKLRF